RLLLFFQILLDIRYIESSDCCLVMLQVRSDGAQRFHPSEISDYGHDEILELHLSKAPEIVFIRQVTPIRAATIRRVHQFRITRGREVRRGVEEAVIDLRSVGAERVEDVFNGLLGVVGERKSMLRYQSFINTLQRLTEKPTITGLRLKRFEQFLRSRPGVQSRRPVPREQLRYEFCPIDGSFEERLVHQQLQHVLLPDIDNECNLRVECRYITEVLFRPNADIRTARLAHSL